MSDTDRISDYFARLEDDSYRRTLIDGCIGCSHSLVFCRAVAWTTDESCCSTCSH